MKIAVIGLGHVGLPTALGFSELGWEVLGVDDDPHKSRQIAAGRMPFYEPGAEELLRRGLRSGRFRLAPDVAAATAEAEVVFVCVGTPQRDDGSAELSQVEGVARAGSGRGRTEKSWFTAKRSGRA
jgi:UDPglucose 6-dehydrogenase